jgi:hypothetical protein
MNKNFLGAALLLAFGAIPSTGCAVETGTESEMGTSEAALASEPADPSDNTDTTDIATDTVVAARKGKGGGIPSNCKPTGGHDPYSGEKMYHCKDAQGDLHLCDEASIKAKRSPCTAAGRLWWDGAAGSPDLVQQQPIVEQQAN